MAYYYGTLCKKKRYLSVIHLVWSNLHALLNQGVILPCHFVWEIREFLPIVWVPWSIYDMVFSYVDVLMRKFAEHKQVEVSTLTFHFDGDELSASDTPTDLDMEDGDCVDVTGCWCIVGTYPFLLFVTECRFFMQYDYPECYYQSLLDKGIVQHRIMHSLFNRKNVLILWYIVYISFNRPCNNSLNLALILPMPCWFSLL